MFKFVHAADIHLDSPMHMLDRYDGAPVDEIRSATRRALENLVALAMAENADFVLICGDLYDGDWRDYNTGLFFISQMAKLHEANIPVYIIAGNHDAANRMTKTLRLPPGVRLLNAASPVTLPLEHIGAAIHGQSFPTQAVHRDLSGSYPAPLPGFYNIGMLHTCATGRQGHDPYAPCTVEGLRQKEYDYWALGHVHKRETLSESPFIIFPGNIQGRHIREAGPKGCMVVTVDSKGHTQPEFRPLDVIRWEQCTIDASNIDSESTLLERVIGELGRLSGSTDLPLLVRVGVTGECPAHERVSANAERLVSELRSESMTLSGGRIWVEKVKLQTAPPVKGSPELSTGPIAELQHLIDELASDPDRLKALGGCLDDLWGKLPKELKDSEEAIAPDDPQALAGLLDDVRATLLWRLRHQ